MIGSGGGLENIMTPAVPPNITKILKYVAIYSGNRDFVAFPNRSSYTMTIDEDITKIKKIKILKLILPSEID
jgi:hypothetical protein